MQTESFAVVLSSAGFNKISLVRTVREITGFDLIKAMRLVQRWRGVIAEDLTRAEADRILQLLDEAGASADIVDSAELPSITTGEWSATLLGIRENKDEIVTILGEIKEISIEESSELIEAAPCVILANVPEEYARQTAQELFSLGADLEVNRQTP